MDKLANVGVGILLAPFFVVIAMGLAVFFGLLVAWPLMWAWNYVMPVVFSLPVVTYWQAFSLYVVSVLLIKAGGSK